MLFVVDKCEEILFLFFFKMLTFKLHADVETLLETAIWTSFPLCFVNDTASFSDTIVHFLVLHGAFEKAFARLTSQKAIMVATHFVPAHRT